MIDKKNVPQCNQIFDPNHMRHSKSSDKLLTIKIRDQPMVCLNMDGVQRLCLAQISTTLLKQYSYNEIHNRRVALGINCVQCSPSQLELLRESGAMPVSSKRCGTITYREAERLMKSFLDQPENPKLPDNFAFNVMHYCGWGCEGSFVPTKYNSSRAKCINCFTCKQYFSPNKFIFHCHHYPKLSDNLSKQTYRHPDAANFNAWRRHLYLSDKNSSIEFVYMWEDVKAIFNGGNRKRIHSNSVQSQSSSDELSFAIQDNANPNKHSTNFNHKFDKFENGPNGLTTLSLSNQPASSADEKFTIENIIKYKLKQINNNNNNDNDNTKINFENYSQNNIGEPNSRKLSNFIYHKNDSRTFENGSFLNETSNGEINNSLLNPSNLPVYCWSKSNNIQDKQISIPNHSSPTCLYPDNLLMTPNAMKNLYPNNLFYPWPSLYLFHHLLNQSQHTRNYKVLCPNEQTNQNQILSNQTLEPNRMDIRIQSQNQPFWDPISSSSNLPGIESGWDMTSMKPLALVIDNLNN